MAFGSNDNDIEFRVEVEADGAIKVFNKLGDEIGKVEKQAQASHSGFSRLEAGIVSLNAAVSLGKDIFGLAGRAISTAFEILERGSAVDDVAQAFDRLTSAAGTTSNTFLNQLNKATDETISNFELMQKSNEALRAGIKPDAFITLTEAARALGEEVGGNTTENLDKLLLSFQKGDDRFLKTAGILIDNKKAFEEYAKVIGTTAEKLTEIEKAEAIRTASLEALKVKIKEVGEIQKDAGDNIATFKKIFTDAYDRIALAVGTNDELNRSLVALGKALNSIDVSRIVDQVARLTTVLGQAIGKIDSFFTGLDAIVTSNRFLSATDAGAKAVAQAAFQTQKYRESLSSLADVQERLKKANTEKVFAEAGKQLDFLKRSADKAGVSNETLNKEVEKARQTWTKAYEVWTKSGKSLEEFEAKTKPTAAGIRLTAEEIEKAAAEAKRLEEAINDVRKAVDLTPPPFLGPGNREGIIEMEKATQSIFDRITSLEDIDTSQLFTDLYKDLSQTIGGAVVDGFQNGFTSDSLTSVINAAGPAIGTALGTSIAGPLGGIVGSTVGGSLSGIISSMFKDAAKGKPGKLFGGIDTIFPGIGSIGNAVFNAFGGGDSAGTQARKAADKFFADLFEARPLSVIIDGKLREISDLVFSGNQTGGLFASLDSARQQAFTGIGSIFEDILGIASGLGVNIGNVLANNIGGSLNNLQLLIQRTGYSFEQLSEQAVNSFNNQNLSALEALNALNAIQQVSEKGIPGAIGVFDQAMTNALAAGARGGDVLVDAFQDMGHEAREVAITDMAVLEQRLRERLPNAIDAITATFDDLQAHGIDTIDELASATSQQLIPVFADLQNQGFLEDFGDETERIVEQINSIPSEKTFTLNLKVNASQSDREALQQVSSGTGGFNGTPTVGKSGGI